MRCWDYLKEKILFIFLNILMIIISATILKSLKVDRYAIIFISLLNTIIPISYYIYDYFNRKKYYSNLINKLAALDKKYFISEVIDSGDFLESNIIYKVIEECCKSMKDEVSLLKRNIEEYKEYIEMWVHEIKTPIASIRLLLENNEGNINVSLVEEVEKVENYIEQVLYYARSNDVNKDYIIKKINIRDSVNSVIRKNANTLIERKIKIQVDEFKNTVYSDNKWIEFILQQIISNSIKYMDKEEKIIKISCFENGENTILKIKDNGIGIDSKSIERVFDKGYTGENGRIYSKSTGMGLYLCRKLSSKLGLDIRIKSEVKIGTEVSIIFPMNSFNLLGN